MHREEYQQAEHMHGIDAGQARSEEWPPARAPVYEIVGVGISDHKAAQYEKQIDTQIAGLNPGRSEKPQFVIEMITDHP